MSGNINFESRVHSALAGSGVRGTTAISMAHYVAMIQDEITNNDELHKALKQSIALRDAGAKVSAGVRHSARAARMGSTVAPQFMSHAWKGGASVALELVPDTLERAGVRVDNNAMAVAKGALQVAQNAGSRANIAAGVLSVFHDRFSAIAKQNNIELNACAMAISKVALNAAVAATVATTGVGLVVAALTLLEQAKDTMAMYEVCSR